MKNRIAVIGAGITGLTTAYYLAKEGYEVHVHDQEQYAGMQCSYANGGQLSVCNSEVWTTWGNVYKGLKWMFKKDAPLLVRPSLDPEKAMWMLRFLKETAFGDANARTVETIKLGLEARLEYARIATEGNFGYRHNRCGITHIYRNPNYFKHAVEVQRLFEENGCDWHVLERKELIEREPVFSGQHDIIGGVSTRDDSVGDIHVFCTELEKHLRTMNVLFFYNGAIHSLDNFESYYDQIVVCAGVGSKALANTIKDDLPIYPVKGYSITIHDVNLDSIPYSSILDDEAKIVVSYLGGRLRVAGTAELAGYNYDIRRDRIEPLLKWVQKNLPGVDRRNYSSWACLRPMTPNMMPIVRQSKKHQNVYYNTGHGHLGWTTAPATAKLVTQQIKENR